MSNSVTQSYRELSLEDDLTILGASVSLSIINSGRGLRLCLDLALNVECKFTDFGQWRLLQRVEVEGMCYYDIPNTDDVSSMYFRFS